jgi:hypothetical protein
MKVRVRVKVRADEGEGESEDEGTFRAEIKMWVRTKRSFEGGD